MLLGTLPAPHLSIFDIVANESAFDAYRFNIGARTPYNPEKTLEIIVSRIGKERLIVDLKGRQLRIIKWAVPTYGDVILNHEISVDLPAEIVFRGNDRSKIVAVRGNRIYVDPYPRANEHRESVPIDGLLYELEDKEWVEKLALYYSRFAKAVKISKVSGEEISGNIIFEGAQGILLDEERGFSPHITHSRTTFGNAMELVESMGLSGKILRIGVMRAYATRHGAGPFVTYSPKLSRTIPDAHNNANDWQGEFKIGWFDLVAAKYALEVAGEVDFVAMTNVDRMNFEKIKVCVGYKYTGSSQKILRGFFDLSEDGKIITKIRMPVAAANEHQEKLTQFLRMCKPVYRKIEKKEYIKYLEKELNVPIGIVSYGPKAEDKIELKPLC